MDYSVSDNLVICLTIIIGDVLPEATEVFQHPGIGQIWSLYAKENMHLSLLDPSLVLRLPST